MDYFASANELYYNKCYDEAIKLYQKSIDKGNQEAVVYFNLGVCYIKLEKYEEAINYIRKAIELRNDVSSYYFNLGYCYVMLKDNKKGLIYFNRAWALDNEDKDCEGAIKIILKDLNNKYS
jgi:tetratricopeptide (TPR) repeat protein